MSDRWFKFNNTPKLLNDMEEMGVWVYIVDPLCGVIYSLLKGRNSSKKVKQKEEELINILKYPIRGFDSRKKYCKYILDEKFQWKSKNYVIFGLNEYFYRKIDLESIINDSQNLQYLLFIHKDAGMSLDSIEWTAESLDQDLISGFVSAIDSFGSSFSDSKGLQEIRYRGFVISFAEGSYVKACLFLRDKPSTRLKELLVFALKKWEALFEEEIKNFKGKLQSFSQKHAKSIRMLNQIFLGKK